MRAYTYEHDGSGKPTEGDIPADLLEAAQSARENIIDVVAESSEEFMEKYFAEGTLSDEDLIPGIKQAVCERRLFPIFDRERAGQYRHTAPAQRDNRACARAR